MIPLTKNGTHRTPSFRLGSVPVEQIISSLLSAIGEDPNRDGLRRTPERVARAYEELTSGYRVDIDVLVNGALFEITSGSMVVVTGIEFYSLCEHHLLPFYGQAHVAYLPRERVIGLSKIPRIVEMYARRLQIQERLTQQIAAEIDGILDPLGIGIVLSGQHMCSMMRGVKKTGARMVTSAMLGKFETDQSLRQEFLEHISRSN